MPAVHKGLAIDHAAHQPWRWPYDSRWLKAIESLEFSELFIGLNQQCRARGLAVATGRPLGFVDAASCDGAFAYEAQIAATGLVPTRDNLHDRYNALIWLSAPKTKAALNQMQAQVIAAAGIGSHRGGIRDAATLWDENLLVVVATDHEHLLKDLLRAHQWHALFLTHRGKWHDCWHPIIFGHALLERMLRPYPSITSHALVVNLKAPSVWSASASGVVSGEGRLWPALDEALCTQVSPEMSSRMFMPLPVMGIAGWSPANEDPHFYDDEQIFRPLRHPVSATREFD